ncbi:MULTISPECIES: hypothetical protein [unclassified Bradyrhizobium]|uniref:hypothetical protein n=1 Tax=Bradyrhizobium sp. USDA 4541 TaxID=2817704 RepID=UPI0020A5940D|nr:hypothetical protein [Bradyrhizobium sp. USDA 4541]MCP1850214.1 hypothetical protein [Bradyrhizobium sp. USDA 4541]
MYLCISFIHLPSARIMDEANILSLGPGGRLVLRHCHVLVCAERGGPGNSSLSSQIFVSARAQLAATLTGATLDALRNEIELAEQQSARWSSPTAAPDDSVHRHRVHVRNTARDHSSIGRYPMDRARRAGWHMRGKTAASPFVSLVENPSKLVVSRDPWARAIANNTNTLHTYLHRKRQADAARRRGSMA